MGWLWRSIRRKKMNRAERRRLQKESVRQEEIRSKKEAAITRKYKMSPEEVKQLKNEATQIVLKKAFKLMLAIPTMVIHDKYSQLMRKEADGKNREQRFVDLCLDMYDSFDRGYITLEDLENCLWQEGGVRIGE